MASVLPVCNRWRAQMRQRGQSIAKTFQAKGADGLCEQGKNTPRIVRDRPVYAAAARLWQLAMRCRH
jgi:hypothetical protein